MSPTTERLTPSTSGERVPSGSSNNQLIPSPQNASKRYTLPSHRYKCIRCGCPNPCCSEAGFFLWVLFLILLQGGPIAVLYMDQHLSYKFGSTLSRYQAEQGMQAVLCKTVGIYSVNITGRCKGYRVGQTCLNVEVTVYATDSVEIFHNSTTLIKSEREHLLLDSYSTCFNLDMCKIDPKDTWQEYKEDIARHEKLLTAKKRQKQSYICYYKTIQKGHKEEPLVLLQLNTSLYDLCLWFVLPIIVLCICWLTLVFLCYWFCYPCDKAETTTREYHEINAIDTDRSDLSFNMQAERSGLDIAVTGSAGAEGGQWPTKGPTDNDTNDTGTWPLYWR